jgi:octaprenyl-diphosphate synthase
MSESAPDLRQPDPSRASPLAEALELVEDDLAAVERRLHELLRSTIAIIPEVGGHLAFAGGKRFRPLVALLAARAAGFASPARVDLAAAGELIHTATLLHDDVIDVGEFRRGRPAARIAYGNGLAVLTGDFCLARALQAVADLGRIEAVSTLSTTVTRMAEGEVAQLWAAGDSLLDRKRYDLVIERKTAALVAWCACLGGLLPAPLAAALELYGRELGYAFQIADDVLDCAYGVDETGKARGQDLQDGKLTLPLIYACQADPTLHSDIQRALAAGPPLSTSASADLLARAAETGALDRARQAARDHAQRAVAALAPVAAGAARDALVSLATYVAERRQ